MMHYLELLEFPVRICERNTSQHPGDLANYAEAES